MIGVEAFRSACTATKRASGSCSWMEGQSEGPAGDFGGMDRTHAHAVRDRALLRLPRLAEPRQDRYLPSVPASSYFAVGAGSSFTWMEPERQVVLVVRWIDGDHAGEFFGRVLLVGRDSELSQLHSAFNRAVRGHAQVVRVFGEAGCGKTRLVEEFLSRLDREVVLRRAACSPLGNQTFGALASLVRDGLAIAHDDPVDTIQKKLIDGLAAIGVSQTERAHLTACFAFVLGIETRDAFAQLEPEQLKKQIFMAAWSLAEQSLLEGPLLLVVEDLHWADAASVEHLRYLVDRFRDRR